MSKEDKEKLNKGAADIKKAEAEAAKAKAPGPVTIPKSTRDIREIINERVTVLPGSIGVKIDDDTPIEEALRIMDWATAMSDHVGFMIGDIINFGNVKWGETYRQAMEQTGRAYSTLAGYAETARRIPAAKRQSALSFSAHQMIMRIGDEDKVANVLKDVAAKAEKDGKVVSVRELRATVKKFAPRKIRKPKKVTSGKKGKKGKKAAPPPPPYKPTDAEQSKLDEAEIALEESSKLVKTLFPIVGKLDNKEKKRWLALAEPIVTFYNAVDRVYSPYSS